MSLAEDLVDAYGGTRAWDDTREIRLRVRAGGLAFAAKGRPWLAQEFTASISTREQRVGVRFENRAESTYELDAEGTRGIGPNGRRDAVSHLVPTVRPWSRLEVAAFCAQAIWTYVAVPYVLLDEAIATTRELTGRRLEVTFAPVIRTHGARQVLHVSDELRIVRHDYSATAIAGWAHAAQSVSDHRRLGGLIVGTHRVVRPRRHDGSVRRGPTLVTIDISEPAELEGASLRVGSRRPSDRA